MRASAAADLSGVVPVERVDPGRPVMPTVLVSMPFQDALRPSIQLGLLKALGTRAGFPVRTLHANIDFAVLIGMDLYGPLCNHRGRLIGEWLFSVAAFGTEAPDPGALLLDDFAPDLNHLGGPFEQRRDRLLRLRDETVPAYLDALVDGFDWDGTRVVGFTSTFQQNTASFALARRLKDRDPTILTLFGGANFDGDMGIELLRAVDCIDLAVVGEGDVAFPALLCALAAGADPASVPGVARRQGTQVVFTAAQTPFQVLDTLPVPDYDEFFERSQRHGLGPTEDGPPVVLPVETARGCWWGAKHHCTFCGLNGTQMTWRAKSAGRVRTELAELARRYGCFSFDAVDNVLDHRSLSTLMPDLVASGVDYDLFYEVKSNLTRAQVQLLARAGVRRVQPGIESFSSHVLALMRKGVQPAQNINLLRWAQYYGIAADWNLLWGFPGETEQDYRAQLETLPQLVHLRPPRGAFRIWLERFSPLFDDVQSIPLQNRRPESSYRYVYPSSVDLDRAAYFFEYELPNALPDGTYQPISDAVARWQSAWETSAPSPALTFRWSPGFLQIEDSRRAGRDGTYTYRGPLADLYVACSDHPVRTSSAAARSAPGLSAIDVEEVFAAWQRQGLVFLDGTMAVALALPNTPCR